MGGLFGFSTSSSSNCSNATTRVDTQRMQHGMHLSCCCVGSCIARNVQHSGFEHAGCTGIHDTGWVAIWAGLQTSDVALSTQSIGRITVESITEVDQVDSTAQAERRLQVESSVLSLELAVHSIWFATQVCCSECVACAEGVGVSA